MRRDCKKWNKRIGLSRISMRGSCKRQEDRTRLWPPGLKSLKLSWSRNRSTWRFNLMSKEKDKCKNRIYQRPNARLHHPCSWKKSRNCWNNQQSPNQSFPRTRNCRLEPSFRSQQQQRNSKLSNIQFVMGASLSLIRLRSNWGRQPR